jgi:hypothetical protein
LLRLKKGNTEEKRKKKKKEKKLIWAGPVGEVSRAGQIFALATGES